MSQTYIVKAGVISALEVTMTSRASIVHVYSMNFPFQDMRTPSPLSSSNVYVHAGWSNASLRHCGSYAKVLDFIHARNSCKSGSWASSSGLDIGRYTGLLYKKLAFQVLTPPNMSYPETNRTWQIIHNARKGGYAVGGFCV